MSRVVKPGGEVLIAHLMSKKELAEHHAARHQSVARDILPDNEQMEQMFVKAGLKLPEITDKPGRYVASARK